MLRLLALIAVLLAGQVLAGPPEMTADEAHRAVQAGELLLIDIRTPEEWRASGVAEGAETLDMRDPAFPARLQSLIEAAPGRQVAMICATGGRSGFVTRRLAEMGLPDIANVAEGMMGSAAGPGWLGRGLPVTKP